MQKYIISSRNEKKKKENQFLKHFFARRATFHLFSYLWRKIKYHSLNHYYYG